MNRFLILILAVIICSSCVKDTPDDGGLYSNKKIVLEIGKQTDSRALPILTDNNMVGKNFGFYAYRLPSGSPTYVPGYMHVSCKVETINKVTYSGSYLWPANNADRLKFLAYYPNTGTNKPTVTFQTGATTTTPTMQVAYQIPDESGNHQDVLLSQLQPDTWGQDIQVKFYHALSRLTFEVEKKDFGTDKVVVESVEIIGAAKSGTMTLNAVSQTEPYLPAWTLSDKITVSSGTINKQIGNTGYTKLESSPDDSFMIFPMDNTLLGTNNTILRLNVSVNDKVAVPYDVNMNSLKMTDNLTPLELVMGKHFNFKINIKPQEVVYNISITVDNWENKPVNGNVEVRKIKLSAAQVKHQKTKNYYIYFWSNQIDTDIDIESKGYTGLSGSTEFTVDDVYTGLTGSSHPNFTTTLNGTTTTGIIRLVANPSANAGIYRLILNAAGLKKEIQITLTE